MNDILDINYADLSRPQIIAKYLENLRILKRSAEQNLNISARQFDEYVYAHYFSLGRNFGTLYNNPWVVVGGNGAELVKQIMDRKQKILLWMMYLLIAFVFISYKHEASTIVLRNIQTLIYPGMKLWRKMTLPVISKFPGLTELYDESCLIMNPFFKVDDLNCEPCTDVVNVLDFTHVRHTTRSVPFIFKTNQNPVVLSDLYELYKANVNVFRSDAYRVKSTSRDITNLDELFRDFNRTQREPSHNLWRCNRMPPARLLRQLFIRPTGRLPTNGLALERYVAIDTKDSPTYPLPDAECENMFVQQAFGTRTIILRPAVECRHICKTISVRLPQSFVLSYNWWYWKPISLPDQLTNTMSISLIGSYC